MRGQPGLKGVALAALMGAALAAAGTRETSFGPGVALEPLPFAAIEDGRQRVRYYSSTPDFILLLTDSGATLVFATRVIQIAFDACNPAAAIEGEPAAASARGPFLGGAYGSLPAKIRSYGRVRYRDIYPGIDVVFRGDGRHIEHDFVVAPGADPERIHLSFQGADRLSIEDDGTLVVRAGDVELSISPPVAYQEPAPGPAHVRIPVLARYVLKGDSEVSFWLGPYDRSRTLTIDPVFTVWAVSGNLDELEPRR